MNSDRETNLKALFCLITYWLCDHTGFLLTAMESKVVLRLLALIIISDVQVATLHGIYD